MGIRMKGENMTVIRNKKESLWEFMIVDHKLYHKLRSVIKTTLCT